MQAHTMYALHCAFARQSFEGQVRQACSGASACFWSGRGRRQQITGARAMASSVARGDSTPHFLSLSSVIDWLHEAEENPEDAGDRTDLAWDGPVWPAWLDLTSFSKVSMFMLLSVVGTCDLPRVDSLQVNNNFPQTRF